MLPADDRRRDGVGAAASLVADAFHADVPADPGQLRPLRGALRSWLDEVGLNARGAAEIVIAVGEACSNAMEHGYAFAPERTVSVTGRVRDGVVEIVVADSGRWKAEGGFDDARGRGFAIMRALVDDVVVDRRATGTTVRLVRAVARDR